MTTTARRIGIAADSSRGSGPARGGPASGPAHSGAVGSVRTVEASVLVPALVRSEPTAWLNEYAQQDLYDVRAISLADRWVWRVELQDRVPTRAAAV